MTLTAEQYNEMVAPPGDDQSFEMVGGHRRSRRIPYIGTIEIRPVAGSELGPKTCVRLKDISAKGMAILDRWTAAKGSQFIVFLARNSGRPLRLLCTVRHTTRLPGNLFRTGAEIIGSLPESDAKPAKKREPADAVAPAAVAPPAVAPVVAAPFAAAPSAVSPSAMAPAAASAPAMSDADVEAERIRRSILG